jgi:hypothetical protein
MRALRAAWSIIASFMASCWQHCKHHRRFTRVHTFVKGLKLRLLPGACCSAFDYSAAEALSGFKTKLLQRKDLPADTDLPVVPVSIAA